MSMRNAMTKNRPSADFVNLNVIPAICDAIGCSREGWRIHSPPVERRDCIIYKAVSPYFHPPLAIKIFDPDKVDRRVPEYVFNALSAYTETTRLQGMQSCLTVPRPIGLIEQYGTVAMEWVDAPKLSTLLFRHYYSLSRRRKIVTYAARWLRWFHDYSDRKRESYDSRIILRKIDKSVSNISGDQAGPDPLFESCFRLLEKESEKFDGLKLDHAVIHGDFTPNNLLLDHDRVIGMDFLALERGAVTRDICRFLVYLDIYRVFRTSPAALRRYGCNLKDMTNFLNVYGAGDDGGFDFKTLRFMQFTEIMRRWSALKRRSLRGNSSILRHIELVRLKRMARYVAEGIHTGSE